MATIVIDGKEYPLADGENLNVIQAATRAGVEIPYFCWHPALSVVANCRMCEVEIGSKDPKTGEVKMIPRLTPACQTPARDMTVIVTNSPRVKENQRMVMEYLLIHHPLDCPVCDQAGECSLQDFSFDYGQANHRYVEQRIVNPRKDVSDKIQLNQDRCIMCTRCVRFTREITQTGELEVIRRANRAEIDIFPGRPVDNPLAGNVVDLCPVGALLNKEFLHKQRVWYLTRHDAVCVRCSTGCNIYAEENVGKIWRFRPRFNPHVNDYWICDEGRYSYQAANDPALLGAMYIRQEGGLHAVPVDQAINTVGRELERIARDGGIIAGVLSPFLTVEEAYLMASYLKGLNPANVLALGPVPVRGEDVTFAPDLVTGRGGGNTSFLDPRPFTIHAEKCPNRRGVEAILAHFQGEVIDFVSAVGADLPGRRIKDCTSLRASSPPGSTRPVPETSAPGSRFSSCRTRGRPHWPTWLTSFWPGRHSPRKPGVTSTLTSGSSTPRRCCPRGTAACPTSTCSRSCWGARAARSTRATSSRSWLRMSLLSLRPERDESPSSVSLYPGTRQVHRHGVSSTLGWVSPRPGPVA